MYAINSELVNVMFKEQPFSPTSIMEMLLKNYSCFQLEGISIETLFEVIEEKAISSKNIVGFIPGTDPDLIDYQKAESISRLAYLITDTLANMDEIPTFLEE